jgi:hypothetical protein
VPKKANPLLPSFGLVHVIFRFHRRWSSPANNGRSGHHSTCANSALSQPGRTEPSWVPHPDNLGLLLQCSWQSAPIR